MADAVIDVRGLVKTFGPNDGQRKDPPGHQEVEIGLAKLYRVTGEQPAQDLEIPRVTKVEMGRQFAVAGIVFLVADIRQVWRGDLKHIRTVLGERAGSGWSGEHPGEVEHANPRQRAVTFGQPFPRAVADL